MNHILLYNILLILITGGLTFLIRAFPFIAFGQNSATPPMITYLGKVISPAAIAMLVVWCFCAYFDNGFLSGTWNGIPEIAAGILVVILHLLLKNPLLSIIAGTVAYMLLLQNLVPA